MKKNELPLSLPIYI